jgi:HPt (histidine-containing phosphotransfer) domain-containing protein
MEPAAEDEAVPEPVPDSPILDPSALAELGASTGDDTAFVVELVETYLSDAAAQLVAIEAAIAAGNADALVRPAHTLKSSSATVGARRLADTSRRLELAGRSRAIDEAGRADAVMVRADWDAARAALEGWLAEARAR